MCLSLLLRLIGERGNRGAAGTRRCECGCYCGLQTPRNKTRWLAIVLLFVFGSVSFLWIAQFLGHLTLSCEGQLTPQQRGTLARWHSTNTLRYAQKLFDMFLNLLPSWSSVDRLGCGNVIQLQDQMHMHSH